MKSIIKGDSKGICYICGKHGRTELHHMLHGPYRKMADRNGLTVHLCWQCHRALHDRGDHDLELEQEAQREFEAMYSHDLFMTIFQKSWLMEDNNVQVL